MAVDELQKEAEKVVELLKQSGKKIATAESCTGGMLSAMLISVPGASAVFELGVTAYSAAAKQKILGVREETVSQYGTVCRQTAAEMASGVRRAAHADLGVSVTGVAGPDSSEGKEPGTVYVALADRKNIKIEKLVLDPKSRNKVRQAACYELLKMVENYLSDENVK